MEIKIKENFSKRTINVLFGEEKFIYFLKGPTNPHIFGYPYFDFLWINEKAKPGKSYSIQIEDWFRLNVTYENIKKETLPLGEITKIEESGDVSFNNKSYDFKREITDNYSNEIKLPDSYEKSRESKVTTKIGEYEEKVTKTQCVDENQNYYKSVNISGKNNSRDINQILNLLFPARKLLPDFNQEEFKIDLLILEEVLKRKGIKNQEFEKFIFQLVENKPKNIIRIEEKFYDEEGEKTIYNVPKNLKYLLHFLQIYEYYLI